MTAIIAGYARTPFARFVGTLGMEAATALGAHAARAALARAGVEPESVDMVFAGQVLQAGAGQNPARQAAFSAGVPLTTPAVTLNAVCLSGLEAVASAARAINAGEADIVLALGQESMSRAPHALLGSRMGTRYGTAELIDTLDVDGLTDATERRSMGASTEAGNSELAIGRQEQDAWAAGSHRRADAARKFLATEIEPYPLKRRDGNSELAHDDGIRADTNEEGLARLRPAFDEHGTITAGNASQITDGAAALVVVNERVAERLGRGVATIESQALVAGPDVRLHAQPANAIAKALDRAGRTASDLKSVEINEAFASVVLHSAARLGLDPDLVNPHGGAIALGHPIGASGARIVGSLAFTLSGLGAGSLGAAGICGGGGQGSAVVLRSL